MTCFGYAHILHALCFKTGLLLLVGLGQSRVLYTI